MNGKPLAKPTCSDCHACQLCSETRCRVCRGNAAVPPPEPTLARFFTHGEYLAWKKNRDAQAEVQCGGNPVRTGERE